MDTDTKTATALLSALALAREHGGAAAALQASGVDLDEAGRVRLISEDLEGLLARQPEGDLVGEALALGFLAGRVANRPRARRPRDPTSFVMDRDLLVKGAEGESILRLPWFEEGLFVGRQLPDIFEMPARIRTTCIENYGAAFDGKRGQFAFTSYGHSYSVEAIPVLGEDGAVDAVLGIATPGTPVRLDAGAYERTAERLERSAAAANERAEHHRLAGRSVEETRERRAAIKACRAAERMLVNVSRLRAYDGPPLLTSREREVLQLVSLGLTSAEAAEQLGISPATVRTHLENIYSKLGVSDKAAAVAWGLRHGLIQ
jgi:DNA-binding CsgD family transcriptional regulator